MNNYKNCYENIFDIKDAIFCLLINNKNKLGEISEEKEINYYYKVIEKFETILTSKKYDTSKLDNGENEIFKT